MVDPQTARGRPAPARFAAAVLALLVLAPVAPAAVYGDIEVTVKSEPRGQGLHGYAEFEFLVSNRSKDAAHEVRLTLPKSSYGYGSDYLRAVSRTVTVEPGKTVRVSLAYPERLELRGNGTGVTIDGRDQEDVLSVGAGHSSRSSGFRHASSGAPLLVLYSQSVDTRFPDWVRAAQADQQVAGRLFFPDTVRHDAPAAQWSANWLAYTRYDGIVVTADDLRTMPAEARTALAQYVECGGSLTVAGKDPQLPGPWKAKFDPDRTLSAAAPGFGECLHVPSNDARGLGDEVLGPLFESWAATTAPWQRSRSPGEANRAFSVVADVGVPVKGLLVLMLVFVIVIGPVNLVVLARKKRKLWLFWTVPVVSFGTCLAVLVFMAVTEGWQGQSRVEGFTVLDENTMRASSLGWAGFYTPLPRGGLHFGAETELAYQNGDDPYSYSYRRRGSGSALTLDWTADQHLASGWLTPRVPAHFATRKSERRRERVEIAGTAEAPEAVNGLGADVRELWYMDRAGNAFRAEAVPAGGRAPLKPVPRPEPVSGSKGLRGLYAGDWATLADRARTGGPALLAPRTYLAVLDASPFLDDALPAASVHRTRSVVYGVMKEGG